MTKVLIIGGVGPLREAIADVLRDADFSTLTAGDGVEGLEQVQTHLPDLILCNMDMPRLDGYGVFTELQRSPKTASIPFLLMTSPMEQSAHSDGEMLGVDRLYKPFNVSHLVSVVQTKLSKARKTVEYQPNLR